MRLIEREVHPRIREWLDRPEIIVILGSRQVGKTILLKMLLDELNTDNKIYLDLEDLHTLSILETGVEQFLSYLELQGLSRDRRVYVGIDEIQYLTNPSNFLKLVHDHYPQIKLIVSGSSTLQIRQKFTDSLAGRKMVFELSSFSFAEFLRLRDEQLYRIKQRVGNIGNLLRGEISPHIFTELKRRFPVNERLFYWKTLARAEVDFVIQTENVGWVPVEVKARLFTSPRISRSFRSFIDQYHPQIGIVINPGYAGTTTVNDCTVYFLPAFGV